MAGRNMLSKVQIKDFGPMDSILWQNLAGINLVIGNNASGKTYLLKILYALVKSIELTGRGDSQTRIDTNISEKLYWTFQVPKLSDLIRKGTSGTEIRIEDHVAHELKVQFGASTEKQISNVSSTFQPTQTNSIFLPAKEVLSLFKIIKKSREVDQVFGFDDTYLDLVRALEIATQQGKNYTEFAESRRLLADIINGRVSLESNEWIYKQANLKYPIQAVAEGIKKVSILDTLLGNRYLTPYSIVFIDEPESALHPEALTKFMDIVYLLSNTGIQFFIATHSYFVLKKLMLLAKKYKTSVPLLSFHKTDGVRYEDLMHGLPENPIVQESIRLYEEEVELSFQ
jgi:predicted ATPase